MFGVVKSAVGRAMSRAMRAVSAVMSAAMPASVGVRTVWAGLVLAVLFVAAPGAANAQATCSINFSVAYNKTNYSHVMSMTQNTAQLAACDPRYVQNSADPSSGFSPAVQAGATANGGSYSTQVNVNDDTIVYSAPTGFSGTDTFTVYFCNDASCSSAARIVGTVSVNVQAPPSLSINDVSVAEGNAGTSLLTFTVSLSSPSAGTVTVNYATANNTAVAGSDYVASSGTVTFAPGETSKTISVVVNGDTLFEPTENFFVNLSGATNAVIADNQGVGTITNDDIAPPTVTSVSPTAGPTGGGTSVTITGTNFTGVNAVSFGGTSATGFTFNSATSITATSPAGSAGTVDIRVTTGSGTSATGAADQFTYVNAPTVTSVSPTAGPAGGGQSVIITGTGFAAAPGTGAVKFGAANATYVINSNTQITATSPANSMGTYDITVTTVGGTSATSAADQYTYLSAPTVSAVSPTAGPTSGGRTVTITGSGFAAAAGTGAVKFGAANATYTINSNTQITATSPANAAGTYDVTVTTLGGTSATNAGDQYTYVAPPTVTSVSPNSGPTSGGTSVTLTGTNFNGVSAVTFGGTAATGFTFNSGTSITASAPAGFGTVDIRVTTGGGTSATSASDQFTYLAAPVSSSQTYGSIVPYNDGANAATTIPVSGYVTGGGTPTGYAVGSATTAQGGSVSINSSGQATYTPPVGYRNANDSFTWTASNAGGTSSPATVTITIGNPTITMTLPSSTATVERVYNAGGAPVALTGGRSAYTVNSIYNLPSGLTDAGGGVISGTPAANGTYTVTVNVTDSSLGAGPYNANTTATLTVGLPSTPVASSFNINGLAYNSGSATATTFTAASHVTENPTGYQVGASSYGATVSVDSAGLMSYTPPIGFRGTDTFNYVGTNAGGTSNVGQVFVTVDDPIFAVTLPASTGTVGEVYNSGASVVTITGGNAPYNNFSATGLPVGLTMDSSGVISGTPTTAGSNTITVTVTDSSGGNGNYTGTATANLAISAPTIVLSPATGALPGAQVGMTYGQTITATGGVTPLTWDVTVGAVPPGLSLDAATGEIAGTPTSVGNFNFSVTATDSSGNTYAATALYSIAVGQGAQTISFGALSNASLSASPLTLSATASSGLTVSFVSTTTNVCTVSGVSLTLLQTGTCSITASQAGDGDWSAAPDVVQAFTVTPANLTISADAATGLTVGGAYSQANTAVGGVAPYSYQLTAGAFVPGTTVDAATGAVSGTPTVAGSFSYIIGVSDSQSPAVTANTGVTTVTIAKGDQTVSFTSTAPAATIPGPDHVVAATATSGLDVTYTLDASSTGCSLSGSTVSFTGVGTCVINADQAGDGNWNAAVQVQQSFAVVASPPTAADLNGVAVAYNSAGTQIDLSGSISGGAHTSIAITTPPAHGTVTVSGDVVTYTPATGYFGPDSFTWTATGLGGTSNQATVSLSVATPATPTVSAISGVAVGYNSTGVTIDLSGSVSGVYATLSVDSQPGHGMASVVGTTATYIPAADYFGPDSFTFVADGPGGTSSPATVSVTVAAPPPPVVTPPTDPVVVTPPAGGGASQPVTVSLGSSTAGVTDDYRVSTDAQNGSSEITGDGSPANPWVLKYTPASNFLGTDTVSVVASGPGGDSAPATFTFQVPGKAPDLSASVASNASVTVSPTAGLVGGPFSAVRITGAPAFGSATVSGLNIVFTPGASNGGSTFLTYVIDLPFGTSAAGRIDMTSNLVPGAQALTAQTLQGVPVTVRISDTVGGPFTGAAVTTISPTTAGTATVSGAGGVYNLVFTPATDFSGQAVVGFTLTNASGTTAGTVTVTVEARPDPGLNPEVRGVATSQVTSARRFADAQINNFQRRLQALHDGDNGSSNGLSLNVGFGGTNDADNDPRVALRRQLGVQDQGQLDPGTLGYDRDRDMLGLDLWADRRTGATTDGAPAPAPATRGFGAAVADSDDDRGASLGFWTAGSVDWGRQDAQGQRDSRFTTQGVTAGLDVRISDTLIVGGGLGYGEDKTKIGDNGSVSTGHGLTGALYASWRPAEAFYIDGVIGLADLDFSSRRWTDGIGGQSGAYAEGDRSGSNSFLSAAFGRIVRRDTVVSQYYARLDARSIKLDSFTETGAGLSSLIWEEVKQDSVSANLGASWRWLVEHRTFGQLRPSARVEWSHELEDIGSQGVRYADWAASPTYLVPLDAWSRDTLRIELGTDWAISERMMLGIGYRGGFGDAGDTHGGELRFKYGW